MESTQQVTLVSIIDGTRVDVDPRGARLSGLLKNLLEEYKNEKEIQIPEIKGTYLTQIAVFLNHYSTTEPENVAKPLAKYDIGEMYGKWDEEYLKTIPTDKIYQWEFMDAANYLDCKSLVELMGSHIAIHIKDFNGAQILEYFGLVEDMTDEDVKKMELDFEAERQAEREAERLKEIELSKEENKDVEI